MAELDRGAVFDVRLHAAPSPCVVADLLASCTDRDVPSASPDPAASRIAVSDAPCVVHDPHADRERLQDLLEQVERRWTRRAVRQ